MGHKKQKSGAKKARQQEQGKRRRRAQERIKAVEGHLEAAVLNEILDSTDENNPPRLGRPFVVGLVDGVPVYSSKLLRGLTYAGIVKQRWLRRTARRLLSR